jgi:hypothetical protein
MKRNKMSDGDTLRPGEVIVLPAKSSLRTLSAESPSPN